MSTELLLSPRWRSSEILTPAAEYDFSLEENFSLRRTLRSAMIPISCLTANHCVPVDSDGRSPQMCRVFLSTEDFEIPHSPPLLPRRRLGDAPRRVPTPNNFYSLFDSYKGCWHNRHLLLLLRREPVAQPTSILSLLLFQSSTLDLGAPACISMELIHCLARRTSTRRSYRPRRQRPTTLYPRPQTVRSAASNRRSFPPTMILLSVVDVMRAAWISSVGSSKESM
ncbi:hypothetical protein B0H14DRAFT_1241154 [Mycena olivaceomarginata]|nr:hypothetical protein B0H14DRAFT_1241154 [Mycena olivaceomarginata]